MDLGQLACDLAPSPNINTIPDELLLKTLTFVPYPGPAVKDSSVPIKHHDALKVISSRFNSIMSTKAFKIELLRCQYNDEVQLYDTRNVATDAQLRDITTCAAFITGRSRKMMMKDESNNMHWMLRTGMLVVNYLSSMSTFPTITKHMMLIEWANSTVFSARLQSIIRFALARVQDIYTSRIKREIAPELLSDLEQIESRSHQGGMAILQMHRYRAFETTVLLNPKNPSQSIPDGSHLIFMNKVNTERNIACQSRDLVTGKIYSRSLKRDVVRHLAGYHWRFFSPRSSESLLRNLPSDGNKIGPDYLEAAPEEEARCGLESFRSIKQLAELPGTNHNFLDIDLKAVGEFLRRASNEIMNESNKVPQDIVRFAEEARLLRRGAYEAMGEEDEYNTEYENELDEGEDEDEDEGEDEPF